MRPWNLRKGFESEDKTMSTSLSYQSSGSAQAQTILFLHGGGVAGWMWDPVVARLQDFHCLVPDLPEHGASMGVRPFTMELAASHAAELVREQAHGGKAVVVGLSEGAQVAVQMLATAPELIERAVISSALLLPMPGSRWMSSPALLAWSFRLSVPPFRKNEGWMRLNMKRAAAIPEAFYPQYRENFQRMTESQFVNVMVANQHFRLPVNLGKVNVPTLAIAGMREYAVMKASVRQLAAALPNGQARLIDLGAGASMGSEHNWAMNAPDLFAQTVRSFILDCDLPQALRSLD
jgi:pimeloyl-ACP methyl ester carboxylesterase